MAQVLQHRRATTTELATETGTVGEFWMDETKNTVVVMDGTTAGGTPLAKYSEIPVNVSQLSNDAGYITSAAVFSGDYNDLSNLPTLFSGAYADLTGKPTLFSGDYNDLSNLPTLFDGAYGSLTDKPDLSQYATISYVGSQLAPYATQSFVSSQLSNYATESFVFLGYVSKTAIKAAAASSADFNAFKAAIAAL